MVALAGALGFAVWCACFLREKSVAVWYAVACLGALYQRELYMALATLGQLEEMLLWYAATLLLPARLAPAYAVEMVAAFAALIFAHRTAFGAPLPHANTVFTLVLLVGVPLAEYVTGTGLAAIALSAALGAANALRRVILARIYIAPDTPALLALSPFVRLGYTDSIMCRTTASTTSYRSPVAPPENPC